MSGDGTGAPGSIPTGTACDLGDDPRFGHLFPQGEPRRCECEHCRIARQHAARG